MVDVQPGKSRVCLCASVKTDDAILQTVEYQRKIWRIKIWKREEREDDKKVCEYPAKIVKYWVSQIFHFIGSLSESKESGRISICREMKTPPLFFFTTALKRNFPFLGHLVHASYRPYNPNHSTYRHSTPTYYLLLRLLAFVYRPIRSTNINYISRHHELKTVANGTVSLNVLQMFYSIIQRIAHRGAFVGQWSVPVILDLIRPGGENRWIK